MTAGTTRFVGARLREAREARGLTATWLADILGVSRAAVSQYETGKTSPSITVMERIALVLDLPPRFFLNREPKDDVAATPVFYRSMSAATKTARVRAERRYAWLRRIVAWLAQHVQFARVSFPESDIPQEPERITASDIEDLADLVRDRWGTTTGPLPSVVGLLEEHGAVVARVELGAATLDAFSEWNSSDDTPYFVLNSDKESSVRSRYDASHELGHMMLHRRIRPEVLRNPTTFRLVENQAHRFASAFLMPEQEFADDISLVTMEALISLKTKWQVSIAAMIKRAQDLNLITPDRAERLWINLSRRGWRRREPLDDCLEAEEPSFLRRAFDLLLDRGGITPAQIEAHLNLRSQDIEQVCGLPPGHLGQGARTIRLIRKA